MYAADIKREIIPISKKIDKLKRKKAPQREINILKNQIFNIIKRNKQPFYDIFNKYNGSIFAKAFSKCPNISLSGLSMYPHSCEISLLIVNRENNVDCGMSLKLLKENGEYKLSQSYFYLRNEYYKKEMLLFKRIINDEVFNIMNKMNGN